MPDYREAVARAIRKLREERGLPLQTLAERSGLSASWLRKLETGKHESTWRTIAKVADGLGVSVQRVAEEIERIEQGR